MFTAKTFLPAMMDYPCQDFKGGCFFDVLWAPFTFSTQDTSMQQASPQATPQIGNLSVL